MILVVFADEAEGFVFKCGFVQVRFDEGDCFGVVLAHLFDEDAQFSRIEHVGDVLEPLEAEEIEDVAGDDVEREELVDRRREDVAEVLLHAFVHAGRFDGLLVELEVAAQVENGHVLDAEDLIFEDLMVHAGIAIEVLLLLNVIELLDDVFLEFLVLEQLLEQQLLRVVVREVETREEFAQVNPFEGIGCEVEVHDHGIVRFREVLDDFEIAYDARDQVVFEVVQQLRMLRVRRVYELQV